ncbi:hypothetical protein Tsubulata_011779 [Turnera subulata]|uniref:Peptidase S8/S53 domain-containing protein n=1 Tax=Turnera subulata TaxID=218843 RepID=A0A9Q0GD40_9ROSI|nr:hypothetical protein Tsubulata_011779 [Turnera subulata]
MQPDISAPGVDILAAFPPTASPTDSPNEKRSVKFCIASGTSVACPHVASVAAYVKASTTATTASMRRSIFMRFSGSRGSSASSRRPSGTF